MDAIVKLRKVLNRKCTPETIRTKKYKTGYNTNNEITFIKGLGTFAPRNKALFNGPNYEKHLLKNYIKGALKRELWGAINKHEAIAFATEKLRHL